MIALSVFFSSPFFLFLPFLIHARADPHVPTILIKFNQGRKRRGPVEG